MKSRELLSIVLSLIMVLGVTAGAAYAQTDEIELKDSVEVTADENLEETENEQDDTRDEDSDDSRYDKHDLEDKLDRYCEMTDEEKRDLE